MRWLPVDTTINFSQKRQPTIFIVAESVYEIEGEGLAGRRFCAQTEGLTERQASHGGQTLAYLLGGKWGDVWKGDFFKGDLFK